MNMDILPIVLKRRKEANFVIAVCLALTNHTGQTGQTGQTCQFEQIEHTEYTEQSEHTEQSEYNVIKNQSYQNNIYDIQH